MKARPVKKLDPTRSLGENAARIIQVRLDEMRSFAPKALDGKAKAQHDMRIAAKRVRYVLEATGFCFGRPADTARRRARDLQDILGEIHDCEVMMPRVRAHLDQLQRVDAEAVRSKAGDAPDLDPRLAAQARHRTAYRGLDLLSVYLEARRRLLFDRFEAFWRRQEETGTWTRLDIAGKPADVFEPADTTKPRFGLLYLHKGRWLDRQVIPERWVEESVQAYSEPEPGLGYGYMWWAGFADRAKAAVELPPGSFSARGHGGQLAFVIPAYELVVVHRAPFTGRGQSALELGRLLRLIFEAGQFVR